jgi:hypothetical protein
MKAYYTVVIPYVESGRTEWHPTEQRGPFSVITRGAFDTEEEARSWGNTHLGGAFFNVKRIDAE